MTKRMEGKGTENRNQVFDGARTDAVDSRVERGRLGVDEHRMSMAEGNRIPFTDHNGIGNYLIGAKARRKEDEETRVHGF